MQTNSILEQQAQGATKMRIKNAFRILLSNIGTVYKIVLYRFIGMVIFALVAYFAVLSELKPLFEQPETTALREAIDALLKGFLSGHGVNTETLRPAFDAFTAMLSGERDVFTSVILETGALIFALRFFYAYGDYAFASMMNGFMSSMNVPGFFGSFLGEMGKAALYALIVTLITTVAGTLIIAISVIIVVYALSYISVFAIILSVAFLVFGFTLERTLLSAFLPGIVCGKKGVGSALSHSAPNGKNLSALLGSYSFLLLMFFYINMSFGLFTLYIGLIVSLPLTALYFTLVSLTDYYIVTGRSYYVDYDTVVSPKEKRENAELLKYL